MQREADDEDLGVLFNRSEKDEGKKKRKERKEKKQDTKVSHLFVG